MDPASLPVQLAAAFAAALAGGGAARFLHLPRVVGYLFAGVALGPYVAGAWGWDLFPLPPPALSGVEGSPAEDPLRLVPELALALVMLQVGAGWNLPRFRRVARRVLAMGLMDAAATAVLVCVAAGVLTGFADLELCLLLGVLAIATAPATTLLVIKEYQADGPLTQNVLLLLGLNNFVCLVLFDAVFFGGRGVAGAGAQAALAGLALNLGAGLLLGLAGAVVAVYAFEHLTGKERTVALLGLLAGLVALCQAAGVPALLTFLVFGVVLANISQFAAEIVAEYDGLGRPLYVLFFVHAGARMHLGELLTLEGETALLMAAYVGMRTAGKLAGTALGARVAHADRTLARWTGPALLSQAGLAIGLGYLAARHDPALGGRLLAVVLPSIVIFEVLGPLGVRWAVLRAGEVKLIALVDPGRGGRAETLGGLLRRLLVAVGLRRPFAGRSPAELTARDLMNRNVPTLPHDAPLGAIVDFLAHHHVGTICVADRAGRYRGVISYHEIRELLYDPSLPTLIIAQDLLRAEAVAVAPDTPLPEVFRQVRAHALDAVPVVEADAAGTPRVLGAVAQRDLLWLFGRESVEAAREDEAPRDAPGDRGRED